MWQAFAILVAYVIVGVILTLPMQLIFGIDYESNLWGTLVWTWPLWGALTVVICWQILAMCFSKIASPISCYRTWSEKSEAARKQKELREIRAAEREAQNVERERRRHEEYLRKVKELREQQQTLPVGPREGVKVRPPETADDFESVCAEWLKKCGVPGATRTPKGSDRGVDVIGGDYAGQCKFYPHQKTTAPEIRESAGARLQAGKKKMLFFHYGPGFTDEAKVAARKLNVELWRYLPAKQTFHRET